MPPLKLPLAFHASNHLERSSKQLFRLWNVALSTFKVIGDAYDWVNQVTEALFFGGVPMFYKFLILAAAFVAVLPASVLAGGPPELCLPVDGVTAENSGRCADLLTTKLAEKLWSESRQDRGLRMQQHAGQWYVTFYMKEDVGLNEVESALAKSGFSIPRDKLHMFGHTILEIDGGNTATSELLAALKSLPHTAVAESKRNGGTLLVTLDMPYPQFRNRGESASLALDTFRRNDFSSDQATKSESPATPQLLPSYSAIRDVVAKHNLRLKEIRWSTDYACRTVGCVAVPNSNPPVRTAAK